MNNVYSHLPARMDDGRVFSNWDPTAVINDKIRVRENIRTNSEYRAYLQKNAVHLMKVNENLAYQTIGTTVPYSHPMPKETKDNDLEESYKKRMTQ
jgi:hypothetical protein